MSRCLCAHTHARTHAHTRKATVSPHRIPVAAAEDWFGLHFVETWNPALEYLKQVRLWLDAHPSEIVVLWFSKHGNQCDTVYDNVTHEQTMAFWNAVVSVFEDILFDTRVSVMNTTTVSELLDRQHRVVIYTAPGNFSSGSPFAQDACSIANIGLGQIDDLVGYRQRMHSLLSNASDMRASLKANNSLFLLSMAGSGPRLQLVYASLLQFFPIDAPAIIQVRTELRYSCRRRQLCHHHTLAHVGSLSTS